MLKQLEISNYALIENVKLTLDANFTVITGETGAGKSILLKALSLILGERADTSVIKQNENKCILEAHFDIQKLGLEAFFIQQDLDYESMTIIRREFSSSGKSRCFVNDSLVQLNTLKDLGDRLINIHTQHETLHINDETFQFDVLDQFAELGALTKEYSYGYAEYRNKIHKKIALEIAEAQNRKEKDYLEFLVKELDEAELGKINLDDLKSKEARIQNSEKIIEHLQFATSIFENTDVGPTASLKALIDTFENLKKYDSRYADILSRLISAKIEIDDIENEVGHFIHDVYLDEEEAQLIKEKMEVLNSLTYKHNVYDIEQLIALHQELSGKLQGIEDTSYALISLDDDIAKLKLQLEKQALIIRNKRIDAIPILEQKIKLRLKAMAMEDAVLKIELTRLNELGKHGLDEVSFLFSANKGSAPSALKKVASGGELSRLMLALLESISDKKKLPTMIFDEIDTGVSGEVASKMANTLKAMGKNMQVIAITHLPQVAAAGKNHLFVSKKVAENKTRTFVKTLNSEERVVELAKMISGEIITDAARENASILLKNQ